MQLTTMTTVSGICTDFEGLVDSARVALQMNEAISYDPNEVFRTVANSGFGVLKADSFISRDITDLIFSYDEVSNLATVVTTSPSRVPHLGNQAPLVGSVLPFVADKMEDALLALFVLGDGVSKHAPIEAFLTKAASLSGNDYVITEDRFKTRDDDPIIPFTIDGMKSLAQIQLPYLKELKDKAIQSERETDVLRALGEMIMKLADTPEEFEAMLNLEYGPVMQYYWMAYCAFRQRENERDRALRNLYTTKMSERMVITSPYRTEILTFSQQPISGMVFSNRQTLQEKGVDLETKDVR